VTSQDGGGRAPLRRRRLRRLLVGVGVFGLLLAVVVAGNTIGRYGGWTVAGQTPIELGEKLRPFYRVMKPEGSGPFPTALLYSGCDGPHDNLDRWGAMLNDRGWAALVVDSHGPRGYLDYDVWRLICAGQLFMGSERAADVLVSIYDARRMPFVDRDRMVLIGSSHGGWAIMELFAFEAASQPPFGLTALPDDMVEDALAGIVGAILVYPYCGSGNRSRRSGWSHPAPVLFLLSGDDLIAPAEHCLDVAKILAKRGIPVEEMVFEHVTHGFDQVERAPFSAFAFDAAATEEALEAGGKFLDRIAASTAPGGDGASER
jgi:dienelactone hydrolase